MAVAILNAVDQRRLDALAAVREHRIGRDHAHHGGLARAERERQIGRQIVIDAEALGVFGDQRHADVLRKPHRHHVARMLDAEAQRLRPVELVRIVFRLPDAAARALIDLDRRIHHDGRGRVAVVERGGVNERLERRARLAQRLRGAVELALVEREAADHCEHAAGPRVHHDHRAGDFRYLTQAVLAGILVERLDVDDVAGVEHLAHLRRRACRRGLRPFHAIDRDVADLAILRDGAARIARRAAGRCAQTDRWFPAPPRAAMARCRKAPSPRRA